MVVLSMVLSPDRLRLLGEIVQVHKQEQRGGTTGRVGKKWGVLKGGPKHKG